MELKPCSVCGARLRRKRTVHGETVFDHPRNGCENEYKRVRGYAEAIDAWNSYVSYLRRVGEGEKE